VYLPAGDWIDLYSGTLVHGGQRVVRSTSLSSFPLYVRAGSAIGFNERLGIWPDEWGVSDLSRPGLAGWLVAPGGRGTAISSSPGRLDVTTHGDRVTLRLSGAPAQAQVVVLAPRAPVRVVVDGRELPRAGSLAALRSSSVGWAFTAGPFGGIVLKLRPDHRVVDVTIAGGR
jgi:alpha-D-xyloside xylohydrolase